MPARLAPEELLARLVAFDTTSHRSNRPLVDFVSDYLSASDVRIDTVRNDDKLELHVQRGPEEPTGAGLALCGHTDCVPALEPEWHHDPFELGDTGESWTGRGACDMKGFLALAIDAFARRAPSSLAAPLSLLLTSDEEVGSLGVRRWGAETERRRALPRSVVVGEPTGLEVVRLHKGHLRGAVTFRGVGAHSGFPDRGVSAIEAAGRGLAALAELQRQLREERPGAAEHFAEVPFEVINPALIRGGTAVNVIPDHCRVDFGVRLLPGSDAEGLVERMRRALDGLELDATWEIGVETVSPPLETAADAPLHRRLGELLGQTSSRAMSFSSDAGVLSSWGFECVLFGPGSIEVAHRPNEYLPKAEFRRAATLVDELIGIFCGGSP